MSTQLISVFNGTISNETTLLCNARDLHAFLGIGKVFAARLHPASQNTDLQKIKITFCFPKQESNR